MQLAEQTATLLSKATLNEKDILDLEWINTTLTWILVKEDQCCRQLSRLPWSPDLQQAYLLHRYWIVQRTAKHLETDFTEILKKIEDHLNPDLIDKDPATPLSKKLRHVQKKLRKAKREADQLCQKHLEKLLNQAVAANQSKNQKH